MARWTIKVWERANRSLRTYLAQHGAKKGNPSSFVEAVVQGRRYRLSVEEVQARNAEMPEEDVEELIDDAVRWARTGR